MTEYLELPDGRIAYDDEGEGPLVVLGHGLGDCRGSYRFVAPALRRAGYRVVNADLRGHGDSSVGWASYTRTDSAEDLIALVRHVGAPAVVVGHSFAGGAAVIAAAREPSLVAGIVLVDPGARPAQINPLLMAVFLAIVKRVSLWSLYYRIAYPGPKPADFAAYLTALKAMLRQPGRKAAMVAMARADAGDAGAALAEVSCPAMVVMGSKDVDFPDPAREAAEIAAEIPGGAEVMMVDGGGHYPHAQFPDQVTELVLAFLGKHVIA